MGGTHAPGAADRSATRRSGPLHRLPAQCKVLAVLLFVLAVVLTPREQLWAFGVYAGLLVGLGVVAAVRLGWLLRRLVVELPFATFALVVPFVATGERVDVLGLELSREGLWIGLNVVLKATLAASATLLLLATTGVHGLLHGLERLGLPQVFVQIATFMVRYLEVIVDEARRMAVARASRGYDPRWLWQAGALARSVGTLFVRSYERGERVYLAMLSRGYAGSWPVLDEGGAARGQWAAALALPVVATAVSAAAWTVHAA